MNLKIGKLILLVTKKIKIKHKRHLELGFLNIKSFKFLSKSEIAVVPSRWEEPFGRTALEVIFKSLCNNNIK